MGSQKKIKRYSSPPQFRNPQSRYFCSYAIWIGSKKTWVMVFSSFSPQLPYFLSPKIPYFLLFSPQLRYLLCFRGKNSVTGGPKLSWYGSLHCMHCYFSLFLSCQCQRCPISGVFAQFRSILVLWKIPYFFCSQTMHCALAGFSN